MRKYLYLKRFSNSRYPSTSEHEAAMADTFGANQ
jgi:hypothetical protein